MTADSGRLSGSWKSMAIVLVILAPIICGACRGASDNSADNVGERAPLQGSIRDAPLRSIEPGAQPSETHVSRDSRDATAKRGVDTLALVRSFGDTASFGRISSIVVVDSFLVVVDNRLPPFVTVWDRQSGVFVFRFGSSGSGPGEFVGASWAYADSRSPGRVWVYDFQLRRMIGFNPARRDDPSSYDHVSVNYGASLLSPHFLGDTLITNGLFPDYTLFFVDRATSQTWRVKGAPPYGPPEMPAAVGQRLTNRSYLAARPDEEMFALLYQFKSRLDFFDRDGGLIRSVDGPVETEAHFHMAEGRFFWDEDNEIAYLSIAAGLRYVYALFCGCATLGGQEIEMTSLHVFDWDGRLVAMSDFPFPVDRIAVSSDGRTLYASYEEPYPLVGEFKLPTFE